jgi:hypothetical protein
MESCGMLWRTVDHSANKKIFLSVERENHKLGDHAADRVGEESERVGV